MKAVKSKQLLIGEYVGVGAIAMPPVRRLYLTRSAGTPKFVQVGFVQKLTLMPLTSGGMAG